MVIARSREMKAKRRWNDKRAPVAGKKLIGSKRQRKAKQQKTRKREQESELKGKGSK